jgi:diguanylate cyclase (GGDEF)-like protein/PAS domain S-box-containing protein
MDRTMISKPGRTLTVLPHNNSLQVCVVSAEESSVPAVTDSSAVSKQDGLPPGFSPGGVSGLLSSAASAAHVNELLGSTAELTILVDPTQQIVYASQTVASLLGRDPLHVVGHPVSAIVHPNHATPLSGALDQVLAGATLGEAELRFPHASGAGSLPLSVGFSLLSKDGVTEGAMITCKHTITRRAVDAALSFDDAAVKELGAKSPLVLFQLDERGRCVWINDAWVVLTGQPAPEATGLGWLKMVEEGDRDGFRSVAAQAHKAKSGWRQQFRVRSTSDELRWIDAASAPRFNATGGIAGYIVIFADISAEVRARSEVNKRTTIVESNAEYVVMDDRNQRLVYDTESSAPLAQTPPIPATTQDPVRSSLGALASSSQAQYINEIRPAVIADGVWTGSEPQTAYTPPVSAATVLLPAPTTSPILSAAEIAQNNAQPVAWTFDTPAESPEVAIPVAPQPLDTSTPTGTWTGPTWTQSDHNEAPGQTISGTAGDAVYVGLVGPSGQVESIAQVTDSVLEPTEFENIVDQLPAMDTVTGLANRALFQERIRLAMNRMQKDGVSVAVMLATMHGYSDLRRQVGPKTGDDQLFVISKRLEATIRQADTAARVGDEDFAVLGVGWFFAGDVENAAKRFIIKMQEPLPSIGGQVQLAASMGIAMAQPDEPITMILRRAQRARKMAYELGAGRVYVDNGPGREPTKS